MNYEIHKINSDEVLNIRHKVMWPNKSIDYVRLQNDSDGKHFGLFINNKLISVISLFIKNNEAQFRKFATLKHEQGKGYGTILLNKIINLVVTDDIYKLWCSARVDKTEYYLKFGLTITDKKFNKGGVEYVIMERVFDVE